MKGRSFPLLAKLARPKSGGEKFKTVKVVSNRKLGLTDLCSRLSRVAGVPRPADFLIKCASEVRKLKFRDNNGAFKKKPLVPQKEAVMPHKEAVVPHK